MTMLKTVGSSGQITLGKEYAGRQIVVDQLEPGVWLIKTGSFVPDNEQWLHSTKISMKLSKAIKWAEKNKPEDCEISTLEGFKGKS